MREYKSNKDNIPKTLRQLRRVVVRKFYHI